MELKVYAYLDYVPSIRPFDMNPFNGIERLEARMSGAPLLVVLRIHSMELKDLAVWELCDAQARGESIQWN